MGIVRDIAELVLLVLIWWDGRNILKVERATHQLYEFYVNDRKAERAAKLAQLAAARLAKAAKKEAQAQ
jgi:hypothetical protein